MTPAQFWAKVERREPAQCWPWTGSHDSAGYGIYWDSEQKRQIGAHRVAYTLAKGPIPDGLQIDHLCRVPRCVNPSHLEAVSRGENIRRGNAAARQRSATHCPAGHAYDDENTYRQGGRRHCRACGRIRSLAYWRRKNGKAVA